MHQDLERIGIPACKRGKGRIFLKIFELILMSHQRSLTIFNILLSKVVHCDLKAANILTTKTGDVKLTDFGVSLNLKIKESDTGRVAGTPNWSKL